MGKLTERQFYCVNCHKKVTCPANEMYVKIYKNKRVGKVPALKCECSKCGVKLTKFIKHNAEKRMIDKYGK